MEQRGTAVVLASIDAVVHAVLSHGVGVVALGIEPGVVEAPASASPVGPGVTLVLLLLLTDGHIVPVVEGAAAQLILANDVVWIKIIFLRES